MTVYGEQKQLDELQVYDGVVLDLSKVKQTGTIRVKTELIDGIKAIDPAEVELNVVVAPVKNRTLTGLDVAIEGIANGLSAVIRTPANGKFDLTVSGADPVLSTLKASDISIIANVEGLGVGTHVVTLQVDVPAYIQTVLADGQTLTVTIEITDNSVPGSGSGGDNSEEVGGTPTEESPPLLRHRLQTPVRRLAMVAETQQAVQLRIHNHQSGISI